MATEDEVEGYKGAYYVAKYASKHDTSMPAHFRRVRTSQDWAKLPEVLLEPYLVKSPLESLSEYLLRVNMKTDVELDTLYIRWQDGADEYMLD